MTKIEMGGYLIISLLEEMLLQCAMSKTNIQILKKKKSNFNVCRSEASAVHHGPSSRQHYIQACSSCLQDTLMILARISMHIYIVVIQHAVVIVAQSLPI